MSRLVRLVRLEGMAPFVRLSSRRSALTFAIGLLAVALVTALLVTGRPSTADAEWNWYDEQKIRATNGSSFDQFGVSSAQSNSIIVVGAAYDNASRGSVYVYTPDGFGSWMEVQLLASDGVSGDQFGYDVDIHGGRIVVGAPRASGTGAAYVFTSDGLGGYTEEKLLASDAAANDTFGSSVAVDGTRVLVGARLDDHTVADAGSAYLFDTSAPSGTASSEIKIVASDADNDAEFGWDVALDGDSMVIGAPLDSDAGYQSGAAYLYDADGAGGLVEQKLSAFDAGVGNRMGWSVDIDNGVVAAGAPGGSGAGTNAGSVTLFTATSSGISQTWLTAPDPSPADEFGASVSLDGGRIAVGAPRADVQAPNMGAVYVFTVTTPTVSDKIFPADVAMNNQFFGFSVALENDQLAVGAPGDGDRGLKAGAEYVYNLTTDRTCNGLPVTVDLARGDTPTNTSDVILGTTGDDIIRGLGGDDIICGGSGRDRIWGGGGDDLIFGGFDIDRIVGGPGNDTIHGDGGSDRIEGGPGDDVLNGDSGADRISGDGGDDVINGGGGQDRIWGDTGDDTIQGSHQSDRLYGGAGDDVLRGAKGQDVIYGGDGDDDMFGGDNTDYLNGGAGDDYADGQRGADNPLVAGQSGCIAETRKSC